jgi:hypothetical protein
MTADVYAVRGDLYRYGLQRGALANPGRLVSAVDVNTNVLTLEDHGFDLDSPLLLRAEAGGSLGAPLVADTRYYAIPVTDSTFQISATAGGSAVNITTAGESMVVSSPLPVDELLEFYSRMVDDWCTPHETPFTSPYPPIVIGVVAELTAKRLMLMTGQTSIAMSEIEAQAQKQLDRWSKGIPIKDSKATPKANLSVAQGVTADARGWGSTSIP